MIHYHGAPLTPEAEAVFVFTGRHAMVSFAHPEQLPLVSDVCQSFVLDNGAFSAWRSGNPIKDWTPFRTWAEEWSRHPACDWFLIPDVIEGEEQDNDALVDEFKNMNGAVPIWHMHESVDRIQKLLDMGFERLALGSSGQFATVGAPEWWERIAKAMSVLCDDKGRPFAKLHGLRMLNPKIFEKLPLNSADSTNVAQNVGLDCRWTGSYPPPNKRTRGIVLANRIESHQSASHWVPRATYQPLFEGLFS